jgi:hypothetical protein
MHRRLGVQFVAQSLPGKFADEPASCRSDRCVGVDGGGQANSRSGANPYREPGARGEIVDSNAGSLHEGRASHPGEMLHLHFVSADGALRPCRRNFVCRRRGIVAVCIGACRLI